MKVALIRQRYNPYGGAERFVERALEALVAEGSEITLITRDWFGAVNQNFRQVTCDPPYARWLGGRTARDRSFVACVQAEMARGAYDITQSHERVPGCMIFRAGDGVHAAWLEHRARLLGPLQRAAMRLAPFHRHVLAMERDMLEHPALRAVICNSQMVADEIVRFYGVDRSKLHVIYNGVDGAVFHPGLAEAFRTGMRHSLAIPDLAPVLLYVGSGFERKGVPQLLEAFASMPEAGAHLVVVGADRKLKAMQSRAGALGIAQRTHFIGPVKDVRPYYGMADGCVLPTLYDPCPNAVLEAMACGLPVVTSPACGAKEFIRTGRNGWVVDPLDSAALSGRLSDLCGLASDAGPNEVSRSQVAPLTMSDMANRLLSLYRTLMAATPG